MGNVIAQIQNIVGKVTHVTHKMGGWKIDYTIATDLTTDPIATTTLIGIFVWPTPQARSAMERFNSGVEEPISGGLVSQIAQPVILISREALKVGGVFFRPTDLDYWVLDGLTQRHYVKVVTDQSQGNPGAWAITFRTNLRRYAKG